MKPFMFLIMMLSFFLNDTPTIQEHAKSKKKPNIIFIFADDQCYSTVHALGNEEIKTPNLDKLCREGITFSHTYNMGAWNGAVCVASRAMLNTGRTVWRAFATENEQHILAQRGEMWSQLMKKAGYETFMTGKWHVKTEADKLFDHVTHVRPGMPQDAWDWDKLEPKFSTWENGNYEQLKEILPVGYNRPLNPEDTTWLPWKKKFGGFWEGGKHWSEVLADDAISFLNAAKNEDKPFFMYLAFNAAHDPRQSPKEFVEMYPIEEITVPESFVPEYPYKNEIGCEPSLRDEALAPFPRTKYAIKVHRSEYYAIISHMDEQIGRVLEILQESGEADNTYIFFSADHGLAVGNHGFLGKQNMYDHSVRVPFIVVGPSVPKNITLDVDIYLQDIMPTSLEIAGLNIPDYVEFNSLMPFIQGKRKSSFYPSVYGCYLSDKQRMIRSDGYKLIVYPQIKVMRLYNLDNDPLELTDLALNPEYQNIKNRLFLKLLELQKQMDDPLDLTQVFDVSAFENE